MTVQEKLHHLIEELPEAELHAALRFLEYLRQTSTGADPVLQALLAAPPDDEPLSEEEIAESDAAWEAYVTGRDRGQRLDEVRQHCQPAAALTGAVL